ncbi:hypothetical protein [Pseudomonas japonica]|uniref:hypothetical protein n=1 Tax=Pseudomonas japonica TaxID=256466 RepID=UPI0015E444A5|nr:hypothetical protein [Pseudomonas japonica]MBA1242464.1 hypothetical protein [Pseudomonas japonica]MBA1289367.1 hypothetical protein [Pseudomonas japonica]
MCDHDNDAAAEQAVNAFFDELAAVQMPHGIAWGHQTQVSEFRAKAGTSGAAYPTEELLGYLSGLAVTGVLSADQVSRFTDCIRAFTQRGWL